MQQLEDEVLYDAFRGANRLHVNFYESGLTREMVLDSDEFDSEGAARVMDSGTVCSVNYIDHVGVAVENIQEALDFFQRVFGTPPAQVQELADQGVRATLLQVGQTRLELLEPLGEDTPVGRFIQSRGQGLHHLALNVSDLPGKLKVALELHQ